MADPVFGIVAAGLRPDLRDPLIAALLPHPRLYQPLYLTLAFTSHDRVTLDVGFCYMANATGRLIGTLLSGLSYQFGGLPVCLATAATLLVLHPVGLSRQKAENVAT